MKYRADRVKAGFAVMWGAGLLSGLLGIGSGAFKVLALDYVMRLPMKVSTATSNFILQPGKTPAAEVVSSTTRGLYVTEMMGYGFNPVTGDFSRGASGFWIEDGELAYPVGEITISLPLDELLQRIDLVGDDLDLRSSIAAPTFRVSAMTIAGG